MDRSKERECYWDEGFTAEKEDSWNIRRGQKSVKGQQEDEGR